MSFDLVPIGVLVNMFHQLPFKDRVSLGGVNRSFRYASMESISKMKSLDITDKCLVNYLLTIQSFPSLLESCSSTLESIDASWCTKCLLSVMSDFVYPNLKRLDIALISNCDVKKLIGQCRNVRSVVLRMGGQSGCVRCSSGGRNFVFDWPEGIIFEKLEELDIEIPYDSGVNLRRLIGNIPNLKHLTIKLFHLDGFEEFNHYRELSQLLASVPHLEVLNLQLDSNIQPFVATWRLPNLITLTIGYCYASLPILHGISVSFPRLESFTSSWIREIDDQSIMALSQLDQLQELRLTNLVLTKEELLHMMTTLPSIALLEIKSLRLGDEIDGTGEIESIGSVEKFIDFLNAADAKFFQRNLVIQLNCYYPMRYDYLKVDKMKEVMAVLTEMKNYGGPIVEKGHWGGVRSIRYRSCDCDGDYLDSFAFLWRML